MPILEQAINAAIKAKTRDPIQFYADYFTNLQKEAEEQEAAEKAGLTVEEWRALPPHLVPTPTTVPEASKDWAKYGGDQLEPALESGAVALVDARYIIKLAEEGAILGPRQTLPPEAFISLQEIKAEESVSGGLRILCVSYPWLCARLSLKPCGVALPTPCPCTHTNKGHPTHHTGPPIAVCRGRLHLHTPTALPISTPFPHPPPLRPTPGREPTHPDSKGTNLQLIARVLKAYLEEDGAGGPSSGISQPHQPRARRG